MHCADSGDGRLPAPITARDNYVHGAAADGKDVDGQTGARGKLVPDYRAASSTAKSLLAVRQKRAFKVKPPGRE